MAIRYSGRVAITVRLLPDNDTYDVTLRKSGRTRRNVRQSVFVGAPRHLTHAVDSPQAYDDTAHAGVSFILDEKDSLFDEGDFEWGERGLVVHRTRRLDLMRLHRRLLRSAFRLFRACFRSSGVLHAASFDRTDGGGARRSTGGPSGAKGARSSG